MLINCRCRYHSLRYDSRVYHRCSTELSRHTNCRSSPGDQFSRRTKDGMPALEHPPRGLPSRESNRTAVADLQQQIAESGLQLFAEDEFGSAVKKAIELAGSSLHPGASTSNATAARAGSNGPSNLRSTTVNQQSARTCSSSSLQHLNQKTLYAQSNSRRGMATTTARYASQSSNPSTISNLNIGQDTKVIYQGFTGKAVRSPKDHPSLFPSIPL